MHLALDQAALQVCVNLFTLAERNFLCARDQRLARNLKLRLRLWRGG